MTGTHEIVALASSLIERPSVTPDDAGCQALMREELSRQGFTLTDLPSGEVSNLWAVHGSGEPMLILAGHTDVVPTGSVAAWRFDPFTPTVDDGCLYGRGAADMKGSLAAMLLATRRFLAGHPAHNGTIAYLITSDEEGPAVDGTVKVVEWLAQQSIKPQYCLVGRAVLHRVGGRHDPYRPSRLAERQTDRARGAGARGLPGSGLQSHPHRARRPARSHRNRLGRRQRRISAHQLSDIQYRQRYGCDQRDPRGS